MASLFLAFFVCSFALLTTTHSKTVTISTELGEIKGLSTTAFSKTVYNFNGIPYAIPPVGHLRFRQSKVNTKPWSKVHDGTAPGAQCVQGGPPISGQIQSTSMDEDCLFLNIFTTKSNVENARHKLVPVMVRSFHSSSHFTPKFQCLFLILNFNIFHQFLAVDPRWRFRGRIRGTIQWHPFCLSI